ncbi:MAG: T9SS type A sorting domain-containing protein [Bacteroidetes bacterium]|nr:T9SS type A sorting domain-containing protein [Bacteroidota bacterium]
MKKLFLLFLVVAATKIGYAQNVSFTFQVDMHGQTVSANGVHIAGNFQKAAGAAGDWDPATTSLTDANNDSIYDVTVSIPKGVYEFKFINDNAWAGSENVPTESQVELGSGSSYQYKFVNGNAWGKDEGVPSACATNNNRTVSLTADMVVGKVCFGQCGACATTRYKVVLRVDMSTSCDVDSVDAAGSFQANGNVGNNWSGGVYLKDKGNKIYMSDTISLDAGSYEFKFRKITKGNASWEGVANRQLNVTKDDTTKLVCFDRDSLCTTKPAPANVTFVVDLTNETPDANGDIYVMGNFTNPNWQGGAIKMAQIPGKPGFYTATFPNMCPGNFVYKFSNGPVTSTANEESFSDTTQRSCVVPSGVGGWNRAYTRVNASDVTLGYVFNKCTMIASGNGISTSADLQKSISVYPNPMSEYARLELGESANIYQVRITDVTGKTVRTYSNVATQVMAIEKANLASGVYFINVSTSNGSQANIKLTIN